MGNQCSPQAPSSKSNSSYLIQQHIKEYMSSPFTPQQKQLAFQEIFKMVSENSLSIGQHITAVFSSGSNPNQSKSIISTQSPNNNNSIFDQNQQFRARLEGVKVDITHLNQICQKHSQHTVEIIESSFSEEEMLLRNNNKLMTREQILHRIEQSFRNQNHFHRFIFSGHGRQANGAMLIQTVQNPKGEELLLETVFDIFLGLECSKYKTLTFLLDSCYSGKLLAHLFQRIQSKYADLLRTRTIRFLSSAGSSDKSVDEDKYGGALVCRYWSKLLPEYMSKKEESTLSQKFRECNPLKMYFDTGRNQWVLEDLSWKEEKDCFY